MQDGQDGTIADRVEKLVAVPRGGQGTSLTLSVTDHGQGDEIGVVKYRTKGVGDRVPQLSSFV